MSSALTKALAVIERLFDAPDGMTVSALAEALDQPVSGIHRTLGELVRAGYVRQDGSGGAYALTLRLPAMGISYLARAGVTDVAQPILDRLAAETEELVRLSIVDEDRLVWVAVAQGATKGLRYDPGAEQGVVVHLASSAGGIAWLSTMDDSEALMRVARQGLSRGPEAGPAAPHDIDAVRAAIADARARGYAVSVDTYIPGMAAMAVPLRARDGSAIGCLSIAGPAVRVTEARMAEMAPALAQAAAEIEMAAAGSRFFRGGSGAGA